MTAMIERHICGNDLGRMAQDVQREAQSRAPADTGVCYRQKPLRQFDLDDTGEMKDRHREHQHEQHADGEPGQISDDDAADDNGQGFKNDRPMDGREPDDSRRVRPGMNPETRDERREKRDQHDAR